MTTAVSTSLDGEIIRIFSDLLGNDVCRALVDSIKRFDDPAGDPVNFLRACNRVFGDLIGYDIVNRRLNAFYRKYPAAKVIA